MPFLLEVIFLFRDPRAHLGPFRSFGRIPTDSSIPIYLPTHLPTLHRLSTPSSYPFGVKLHEKFVESLPPPSCSSSQSHPSLATCRGGLRVEQKKKEETTEPPPLNTTSHWMGLAGVRHIAKILPRAASTKYGKVVAVDLIK